MTRAKWTKATRAKLHGRRAAHKHDPKDATYSRENGWATLRAAFRAHAGGTFGGDAEGSEHLADICTELQGEPPTESTATKELHRAAIIFSTRPVPQISKWGEWADARALVGFWCETWGPSFALDVLMHPPLFITRGLRSNGVIVEHNHVALDPDDPSGGFGLSNLGAPTEMGRIVLAAASDPCWWALRWWLDCADDGVFADALAGMQARDASGRSMWLRSALAFAFARDPSTVHDAVEAHFEASQDEGPSWNAEMLVASSTNARDTSAMIEAWEWKTYAAYAFDIVEALDEEARPVLERLLERERPRSSKRDIRPYEAALKLPAGRLRLS
jgi:hypothetical protein